MMKKFKLLIMLALLPLFTVTLAGCVDSDDSSDYDSEQTTTSDDDDYYSDDDDSDYDSDDEGTDYDSDDDSGYNMDEEVKKGLKAYYGDDYSGD